MFLFLIYVLTWTLHIHTSIKRNTGSLDLAKVLTDFLNPSEPMSTAGSKRSRFEADDDVDGQSVGTIATVHPPSYGSCFRMRSKTTPTKKRSALDAGLDDLEGGDEDEEMEGACKCYLCDHVIGARQGKQKFNGKFFHKECHNAVRCCRRQLSGQELKDFDGNMIDYPENLKEMCLPLVKAAAGTRDPAARKKAKHFHVTEKHKTKDDVAQRLLLTRNRFHRHHKQWDGWPREKSDRVFDDKLAEQLGLQYYFCCIQLGNRVFIKSIQV